MPGSKYQWDEKKYHRYLKEGRGRGEGPGYKPWFSRIIASICGILLQITLFGGGFKLASLPGNLDPHMLEKTLIRMFSPEWLRDTAKRVKYVQRERKVDPFILFWILVLGFGAGV